MKLSGDADYLVGPNFKLAENKDIFCKQTRPNGTCFTSINFYFLTRCSFANKSSSKNLVRKL